MVTGLASATTGVGVEFFLHDAAAIASTAINCNNLTGYLFFI
jgi:hypothetical protein